MKIKTKEPNLLLPALCLVLASVTFWLYQPVIGHDFVDYDDLGYVTENLNIQHGITPHSLSWALTTGYCSNWHPLTWVSHMLDCQMFGALNPGGHHLTNVILHTANTVLLMLLLWRMTTAVWRSAIVAALFAWHPMHVESVAWIAERKDVLSAFFALLALIAYVVYAMQPGRNSKKARSYFSACAIFFALGLMSKPMVVTLPFVMLLLDFWPLSRFSFNHLRKDPAPSMESENNPATSFGPTFLSLLKEKSLFFAMSFLTCLVTFEVQNHGYAVVSLASLPLKFRLENSLVAYLSYVLKMLWPARLSVLYPLEKSIPLASVIGALAFIILVTALCLKLWRKAPYLACGWFWYLGMLVPVIGIVQVGEQSMADRYSYLPFVGLFIALVWGLFQWVGWDSILKRGLLSLFFLPVLIGCILATSRQITYWQNGETLFRHAIAVTANNVTAYINLATALDTAQKFDEAEAVLKEAEKFNTKFEAVHSGLGLHYNKIGDTNNAEKYFLLVTKESPQYLSAHYNLGNVYSREGRLNEAADQYRTEIRLDPGAADAHQNLGVILLSANQLDDALFQFKETLRLAPDMAEAHERMGETLQRLGHLTSAQIQFEEAVRLKPESVQAHIQLGLILGRQGEIRGAILQFQQALQIDRNNADAWFDLAAAFEGLKRYQEASQTFATALRLRPTDTEAHLRLAMALINLGRFNEAVTQYNEALKQKPGLPIALQQLSWLLSTKPSASFYNPDEALQLALKADEQAHHLSPDALTVLDIAYAASGRFDDAIKTVQAVIKIAQENNLKEFLSEANARLELYKSGKPYKDE